MAPNSGNRLIVMMEQGVRAIAVFVALNRMINNMAKL
jgi:hypothetical protein